MIERYSRPRMKKVWSDKNKFDKWLQVEIAVCQAWAEHGQIPQDALPLIKKAKVNIKRMNEILEVTHHDVTAFLQAISESIGEESRYIHLGLTSSDIIDTALGLQLVEASELLLEGLDRMIKVTRKRAIEFKDTVMIGRTHGVHAEPTTFGLKLALWTEELLRDKKRLTDARDNVAVGKISGAVGTYATVPPEIEERTCTILGIKHEPVSNQVVQRDRHAQFVSALAILCGTLEKMALEIRSLQRTEVREAEEPFAQGQTGSSAMPHKKNPELCERVCGLARLVRGYTVTALENIALWHERDISHSSTERVILPDSCLITDYMLHIFTSVMEGLNVYPENMQRNLELTRGLVFSQRVLLSLIEKGLSRQNAYAIVQRNAMQVWQKGGNFLELLKSDPEVTSKLSMKELDSIFDYNIFLKHLDEVFHRLKFI